MPLSEIAAVLDAPETPIAKVEALQAHLRQLAQDREALDRRISAVEHTLQMRREGREPRMDVMLEGFNDRYEADVVRRWGREAFDASNKWWHAKTVGEQRDWQASAEALLTGWAEIHRGGHAPDSPLAQEHAATHMAWFAAIPGTPTHAGDAERSAAMVCGVADLYESNPDFHQTFGSREAAQFAANALRIHVQRPA